LLGGVSDYSGEVADGTEVEYMSGIPSGQTVFIGFANPAFAIKFNIVEDYENKTNAGNITVSYWDGNEFNWTPISGATTDSTQIDGRALATTGAIQWDGQDIIEHKRSMGGLLTPLYWYAVRWDGDISTVRIWEIAQSEKPDTLPPFPRYDGVIEHAGRAFYWPGHKFKSGLDYAMEDRPWVMNGPRAGTTGNIFGPGIVNAATRLSSFVVISTKNPYRLYLLQGKVPGKFDELLISSQIGVVAPHALLTIEDAVRVFTQNRIVVSAIFMAPDGFYMCDGFTPIKISDKISDYFDSSVTPYIEPAYAHLSYGWNNYAEKRTHFAVPMQLGDGSTTQTTLNREIVYAWSTDEWYGMYERSNPARCGTAIVGNNGEVLTYIGDYNGYALKTNSGVSDVGTPIEHFVQTNDILPLAGKFPDGLNWLYELRGVRVKGAADSSDMEILFYPDGALSGVTDDVDSGATVSMANSGYRYFQGKLPCRQLAETHSMRFRGGFDSVAHPEGLMELYGFTYEGFYVRETQHF
jgi:hypothetical protein